MSKGPAEHVFTGNGADQASSSLPVDQGYLVKFPDPVYERANAWMSFADQGVPLWVYEYEVDFTLAGSTGQSQMTRTFFPRNFQQAQFTIRCQTPNQFEYNRTAEFIRYSQRKAISTGDPATLQVNSGGSSTLQDDTGNVVARLNGLRGRNKGFLADGYVEQIQRGGEFGEFAPEFEFSFVVATMRAGLWTDQPVTIRNLKSWAEILKDNPGDVGYVVDPDTGQLAAQEATNVAEQVSAGHLWNWIQNTLGG